MIGCKHYRNTYAIAPEPTGPNLALLQPTLQSSTYPYYSSYSSRAVDGNNGSNIEVNQSPCSCTDAQSNIRSRWMIDLGNVTSVSIVRIKSRILFPERLTQFNIGLTNTSLSGTGVNGPYSLCDYYPCPGPEAAWFTIYCLPTTLPGRYLFIQHAYGAGIILTLCEVQVYS